MNLFFRLSLKKTASRWETLKENDSVIFFNFRPDRAREITRALCDPEFTGFERRNGYFPMTYVCFTEYDATIPNKIVAFHKVEITNTFGEFLAANGFKTASSGRDREIRPCNLLL